MRYLLPIPIAFVGACIGLSVGVAMTQPVIDSNGILHRGCATTTGSVGMLIGLLGGTAIGVLAAYRLGKSPKA